jgi:hypothetical protein
LFEFVKKNWKTILLGVGSALVVTAAVIFGSPVWVSAAIGAGLGVLGLGFYSLLSGRRFTLGQFALAGLLGGIGGGLTGGALCALEASATAPTVLTTVAGLSGFGTSMTAPAAVLSPQGTPGKSLNEAIDDQVAIAIAVEARRGEKILQEEERKRAAPPSAVPPSKGLVNAIPGH